MPIRPERDRPAVADEIAARALAYLAGDPERLGRFLALSGLDPATIRVAAQDSGFLPSVLDHVLSDERLLMDFADAEGLPPEAVGRARAAFGGSDRE
ncbi:DUF3572 domain-containing protein [Chenggangzhangella methanolivorans]|uniref:DUF3572 domain-containing protein n=1 Tax=Chenggangzhangella methanolivorans TaxID=1437009 RepID=A0A9E6R8J8_9HYPH|nr:DUF3572 domain-containing protein [Chenggangzhangella methanolivorans]QZO00188.1 DUF3572 domain-containing protein [Chenggangzhangella methanolivorans]